MLSRDEKRGSSDAAGSWWTKARSRRSSPQPRPAATARGPRRRPAPGRRLSGTSPAATRPSVVLPDPDSPTRPSTSPGATPQRDAVDGAERRAAQRGRGRSRSRRRSPAPAPAAARRLGAGRRPPDGGAQARHRREQLPGVGVPRVGRRGRVTGLLHHVGPARSTTTRSASSATTPMLWVISRIAVPVRSRRPPEQREDLGLHGDVERGRRLVGEQQRRARWPARARAPPAASDHRRAGGGSSAPAAPGPGSRPVEQLDRPGPRGLAATDARRVRAQRLARAASRRCGPG